MQMTTPVTWTAKEKVNSFYTQQLASHTALIEVGSFDVTPVYPLVVPSAKVALVNMGHRITTQVNDIRDNIYILDSTYSWEFEVPNVITKHLVGRPVTLTLTLAWHYSRQASGIQPILDSSDKGYMAKMSVDVHELMDKSLVQFVDWFLPVDRGPVTSNLASNTYRMMRIVVVGTLRKILTKIPKVYLTGEIGLTTQWSWTEHNTVVGQMSPSAVLEGDRIEEQILATNDVYACEQPVQGDSGLDEDESLNLEWVFLDF